MARDVPTTRPRRLRRSPHGTVWPRILVGLCALAAASGCGSATHTKGRTVLTWIETAGNPDRPVYSIDGRALGGDDALRRWIVNNVDRLGSLRIVPPGKTRLPASSHPPYASTGLAYLSYVTGQKPEYTNRAGQPLNIHTLTWQPVHGGEDGTSANLLWDDRELGAVGDWRHNAPPDPLAEDPPKRLGEGLIDRLKALKFGPDDLVLIIDPGVHRLLDSSDLDDWPTPTVTSGLEDAWRSHGVRVEYHTWVITSQPEQALHRRLQEKIAERKLLPTRPAPGP
jgi:hypothetical protein